MNTFTQEELKNISALIQVAPIKEGESVVVANLLIKISGMLAPTAGASTQPEEPIKIEVHEEIPTLETKNIINVNGEIVEEAK